MILITGGLGFIGSHTAKALLEQGESVVVTRHRQAEVPSFLREEVGKRLFIEQADINDFATLDAIGKQYTITHIVHLAAPKIGALSAGEDLQTNIAGLFTIFRASKAWGVKRTVIASSIGVYGATPNPLREDALLSMTGANPIGAVKKLFEIIGDTIAQHEELDIAFVRPSAIWGPLGRPRSMFFSLPQMLHAAIKNSDHDALGDIYADDGIDMCYVKDCGKAIAVVTTAQKLSQRTYNIGTGKVTTNNEIASAIQNVQPSTTFTLTSGRNPRAVADNAYMDISALQGLGFKPDYSVKRGLEDYAQWLLADNEQ